MAPQFGQKTQTFARRMLLLAATGGRLRVGARERRVVQRVGDAGRDGRRCSRRLIRERLGACGRRSGRRFRAAASSRTGVQLWKNLLPEEHFVNRVRDLRRTGAQHRHRLRTHWFGHRDWRWWGWWRSARRRGAKYLESVRRGIDRRERCWVWLPYNRFGGERDERGIG